MNSHRLSCPDLLCAVAVHARFSIDLRLYTRRWTENLMQRQQSRNLELWLSFQLPHLFHAPDRKMTQRWPHASPHHSRSGRPLAALARMPLIEGPVAARLANVCGCCKRQGKYGRCRAGAGQDREGPNIRCSGLETARFDVKIQVLMTCKTG